MKENYKIRTDLALEINEQCSKDKGAVKGVIVNEIKDSKSDIKVTVLNIVDKNGAKALNRPEGTYITMEAEKLGKTDEEYGQRASLILSKNIEELINEYYDGNGRFKILVAGLGNREVTADSLGPGVIDKIDVSGSIATDDNDINISVFAIAPGVMAQTGMETADVIKGIVKQVKPDIVIAIDSLAARNSKRLNTTIQLSDRGIHPGSGVGNHRVGITPDTIGVPVIAIGVPTVIAAPTIITDTMETFLKAISHSEELRSISDIYSSFSKKEKYELIKEVISPDLIEMYVTPKDIDMNICKIISIVAGGINLMAENLSMTYLQI